LSCSGIFGAPLILIQKNVAELAADGFKTVVIIDPGIKSIRNTRL
jgi:hypothetical protein